MRIIDTVTGETVATIIGGNNMTTDEAIRFVGEFIEDAEPDEANVIINGREYWSEELDTIVNIVIAYVRTNAYSCLIVDNGARRFVCGDAGSDFGENRPQYEDETEEAAEKYLEETWEGILDNYEEWESYEESMEDLTETAEILATRFVSV